MQIKDKKSTIFLVTLGILLIVLVTIMMMTTPDIYSTTCEKCNGTGKVTKECSGRYTTSCSCDNRKKMV